MRTGDVAVKFTEAPSVDTRPRNLHCCTEKRLGYTLVCASLPCSKKRGSSARVNRRHWPLIFTGLRPAKWGDFCAQVMLR